jgi:hypothetical protein
VTISYFNLVEILSSNIKLYIKISDVIDAVKGKGKAFPLQA